MSCNRGGETHPSSKCLHRFSGSCFFALHAEHSSRRTIFLVVLAFLWKTGLVCPPYPDCFRSYRRFPWANADAFPALYWVTLCSVCLPHSRLRQNVFRVFGTFTIFAVRDDRGGEGEEFEEFVGRGMVDLRVFVNFAHFAAKRQWCVGIGMKDGPIRRA